MMMLYDWVVKTCGRNKRLSVPALSESDKAGWFGRRCDGVTFAYRPVKLYLSN